MESIAKQYFNAWNQHCIKDIGKLLTDDVQLKDWNLIVKGKKEVLDITNNVFIAYEDLNIKVLSIVPSYKTNKIICEIKMNFDNKETLFVVNIIKLNNDKKISFIHAFRG